MRKLRWISILLFLPVITEASFHCSGYISLQYLGGYTYQATVVDYVIGNPEDTGSCYDPNRPDLDTLRFYWGDGTNTLLTRSNGNGDSVCDCRKVNIYIGTHTYPGYGTYYSYFDGLPRTPDIDNMLNSVNIDMLIFNYLIISPLTVMDSLLPVLTNTPVCGYGCPSQCYHFNPDAYSPGRDSISYALGNCLSMFGVCPGYTNEGATINPLTGELSWCNPANDGIYNFAILITTYNRVVIDSVPMQIPVDTEEMELEMTVQSNCALGINEISNESGFTLFPNPSGGKFTIQSSTIRNQYSELEIYNMLGEKVYKQAINPAQDRTQINLSNDASGIYLYRILCESGEMVSQGKFIVQK